MISIDRILAEITEAREELYKENVRRKRINIAQRGRKGMIGLKQYIGTKMVQAEPMTKEEFENRYRRRIPVSDVNEGYSVKYPDGYISWSPSKQFEEAYRETTGMTCGLAIEAAKKGHKIQRTGWNGKGMFVVYQKGYPQGIPCNKQTADVWSMNEGEQFVCNPYLQIKCVDGSHSMWVPSINDVLADDWMIIE